MDYAREMEALFRIGLAITSELTMKQVLQAILDECRRAMPVDTLYVAIYDAATDSYDTPLFFDLGEYRSLERVSCPTRRSLTRDVIASGQTLYIPDTKDPVYMGEHVAISIGAAPVVTYLGAPMMMRGRVVGVLSIQSLRTNAYSPRQIRFLETIAMQAAVAVEHARLYEAAQQELTERRQVEAQLRTLFTKYAVLFDTSPVGISITDDRGQILESNPEAERILGVSGPEHQSRRMGGPEWQIVRLDGSVMPSDEYASVRAFVEKRRVDGVEMGIAQANGSVRWMSVSAAPIPLEGYGVAVVYADISERKRMEDALRQSEKRYRLLAENVQDAVWMRDLQGKLVYASPSIERLWGHPVKVEQDPPADVGLPAEVLEAARERSLRFTRAVRENRPIPNERYDLPLQRPDGSKIILDVLVGPLRDEEGKIIGFRFAGRDVTEERAMAAEIRTLNATLGRRVEERTAELKTALQEVQLANHMKDEFLAAVSHELRTPLTVVLGAAEVLGQQAYGPLNDYQQRQVDMVRDSGTRLLKMVNDLLRYARVAAGKTIPWRERCVIAELCMASTRHVETALANKMQSMTYSVTPEDLVIVSDVEAILSMLDALLDNAVKFTPKHGHISLEVARTAADTVEFIVSDDGIGIEPEMQAHIFLPFVQANGGLNRRYEGIGLGLAYVARMAETLGGAILVESEPGYGSRFILTLPVHP